MNAGDVLEMRPLGITVNFLRTAEETGGEVVEAEVSGRPRGLLAQRHVHPEQVERIEVISWALKVGMNGRDHILGVCREAQFLRAGFPRPVAGAELVLDFASSGHAATPSLRVQQALARLVLR